MRRLAILLVGNHAGGVYLYLKLKERGFNDIWREDPACYLTDGEIGLV